MLKYVYKKSFEWVPIFKETLIQRVRPFFLITYKNDIVNGVKFPVHPALIILFPTKNIIILKTNYKILHSRYIFYIIYIYI